MFTLSYYLLVVFTALFSRKLVWCFLQNSFICQVPDNVSNAQTHQIVWQLFNTHPTASMVSYMYSFFCWLILSSEVLHFVYKLTVRWACGLFAVFVCYSSSCMFVHTCFPWFTCPDSAQGIYGCNYLRNLDIYKKTNPPGGGASDHLCLLLFLSVYFMGVWWVNVSQCLYLPWAEVPTVSLEMK